MDQRRSSHFVELQNGKVKVIGGRDYRGQRDSCSRRKNGRPGQNGCGVCASGKARFLVKNRQERKKLRQELKNLIF